MAPHHQGHAHPPHPCVLVSRTGCLSVDQVQLTNLTSSSDRKRENHCQLNREGTHPLGSEARSGHQGTGATAKHAGKKKAATLQKPICAPPEEDRWRCGTSRLSTHRSNSVLKNNFISFTPNPAPFSSLDSKCEGQRPGKNSGPEAGWGPGTSPGGREFPSYRPPRGQVPTAEEWPSDPQVKESQNELDSKKVQTWWAERSRLYMPTREGRKVKHPQCP